MTAFDRLVLAVLAALAAAATTVALIGDRVGVRVVQVWPPADAEQVSTLTRPRVVFDQAMVPTARATEMPLTLTPEAPGELIWSTRAVTLRPSRPLQPGVTYTVHLQPGLASSQDRRLLRPLSWQFTTAAPAVVYLAPDGAGRDQLFSAALTGDPQRLTEQPDGVWDYHLAPDGSAIVYSAPRDQHGNDLFVIGRDGSDNRRLLDCGSDDCFGPRWSPGGGEVAFARRTLPAPPRLYLLDTRDGSVRPVLEDPSFVGFEPRWAPSGEWLAWVAPLENGIRMLRLSDASSTFIPSRTGEPPVWNRDGSKLFVTDVDMDDPHFRTRLVILNVETLTLDAPESRFEEWGLRWAPDGERVSLLRRVPGAAGGGQVWVVAQDGNARQLTDDTTFDHGPAQWSGDGRYLTFQRIALETVATAPEIVLWDTASDTAFGPPLTGRSPSWLP